MPGSRKNSAINVFNKIRHNGGKGSRSRSSSNVEQSVKGLAHTINQGWRAEEEFEKKEDDKLKKKGNTAGIAALIKKFDEASPGRRASPRGTTARRSPPPEEQSKVDGLIKKLENENLLHLSAAVRRKNPKLERERDWGNLQEKIHPGFKDLYSKTFIMDIDKDTGNIAHYKLSDYFRNGKSGVRNPDAKPVPENSILEDENGIKTKYSENGRPTWEALLRVAKAVAKKEKKSQRSPIQVLQAEVGFGNKVDTFESRHSGAVRDIGTGPLFGPAALSNRRSS